MVQTLTGIFSLTTSNAELKEECEQKDSIKGKKSRALRVDSASQGRFYVSPSSNPSCFYLEVHQRMYAVEVFTCETRTPTRFSFQRRIKYASQEVLKGK